MHRSKLVDGITLTLTIVGAINWGLVGLFGFNLVSFLFGEMSWLSRIIYIVIAIACFVTATIIKKKKAQMVIA